MKIRAVRMREVGCFSTPIALEGLSGELDVLAGPNELGKSTIRKALDILFKFSHTSQSIKIRDLKPYLGGAPLIEADFEADGRLWRLRKQFLSEKQTLLTEVNSGKVAARGDEAHRRALELIGGSSGEHRLGLLWLEQGSLLPRLSKDGKKDEIEIEKGARQQLSEVIEREIAAATGGGHDVRVVREKVEQQRRALVTDRRSQPTGEYANAIANRNRAEQELESARAAARAADDRLSRAAELRERAAALANPASRAAALERVQKLTADREAAVAARQQLKITDAKVQACESRLAEAQQACEVLARRLEEVSKLELAASTGAKAELELKEAVEAADARLNEARSHREELRVAFDAASQRLQAREKLDSRRQAAIRLAELSARMTEAQSAAERAGEIRSRLSEESVTAARVAAATREANAIQTLEIGIAAQLPKVQIAYQPGSAGKIRIDGRPVADGEELTPSRLVALEIEGIGTITIDPAVSETVEDDQADLDAHRSVLGDLLAAMGVSDLAAAREQLEGRQNLERELAQAEDRVRTRAPNGLGPLSDEVKRLAEQSEDSDDEASDLPERPEIEAEIARLGRAVRETEQAVDQLSQDQARARESLTHHVAARRARDERLTVLGSELPPTEERASRLAELTAGVAAAQDAVNQALRERTAWLEKAPDDTGMRALEAELFEARRLQQSSADELARVEKELAVVERELERDRQDGIAARVEELEQKARSLGEQVSQFERELAALNLLLDTLADVEQQSRERYLSPVLGRLDPYINLVFPGAKVGIGRDLRVEAIDRGVVNEQLSALSDGTQEQIAVLIRLAFARMLADAGRPTPLILDDALVYSDDSRIEALFDALRQAAGAHQVIVFTCRSRTFEQLGGNRLAVVPWAVQ